MVYSGPDTTSRDVLNALQELVDSYKNLDGQIKAAEGDKDAALKAFVETSDHADAVKLRKTIEDAKAKLNKLAESNVKTSDLSDDAKAKIKVELDSLKGRIRDGRKAAEGVAVTINVDPDGVRAALTEMGDPTHSGRGRKPGSKGSSGPRYRGTLNVLTPSGNSLDFETFGKAAAGLDGYEITDLQKAFASAAGVSDVADISSIKKVTEFKLPMLVNGEAKGDYVVTVTPKETAKPGPKAEQPAETVAAE